MQQVTQRQPEAGLGTREDLVGQDATQGAPEHALAGGTADLARIGETLREGDQVGIEERHADLDP